MQSAPTFGKRGRQHVINNPTPQPVGLRSRPPEARKQITLGFVISMFAAAGLLFAFVTSDGSPDTAVRVAQSESSDESTDSQPAVDENDRIRLQVAKALAVCESLNNLGVGTAPCQVAGASITIHTNSSVAHAQMLCSEAVRALSASGSTFEGKWTLYVKGPHTGGQSLAYCRLP
jgi:hypothetical protein